jgi:uncharacterized protein YuzE
VADRAEEARVKKPKVQHDPQSDALYVELSDRPYARTEELDHRRNIDYDADGCAIGVEFLSVSKGVDLSEVPQAAAIAEALRGLPIKILA